MESFLYATLDAISNYDREVVNAKMKDGTKVFPSFKLNGDNDAECAVIYGDNACGKSFIAKLMDNSARKKEIEVRNLGMGNRTSGYNIHRAIVFGNEKEQSTGVTSYKATLRCLNSTAENPEEEAVMILDEPDIGLSPRYAKALGKYIAERFNTMSKRKTLILVSHNETLIRAFVANKSKPMATLGIGTEQTLVEWIDDPAEIDIETLLELEKTAFARHCAIDRMVDEIKRTNGNRG